MLLLDFMLTTLRYAPRQPGSCRHSGAALHYRRLFCYALLSAAVSILIFFDAIFALLDFMMLLCRYCCFYQVSSLLLRYDIFSSLC